MLDHFENDGLSRCKYLLLQMKGFKKYILLFFCSFNVALS